ncbi:unnamed protein product [Camellia sinensis]
MFLLHHLGPNLLLLITTTGLMISSVTCQPNYNSHICLGSSNNTSKTKFKANLNTLLTSLSSKSALHSFYNDSFNGIFSLYLCRGDLTIDQCQNCVVNASQGIRQRCPSDERAIIWFEQCMLRYSDTNFFGLEQTDIKIFMWNVENNTSPNDPDVNTLALMYTLISKAPYTETMYGADESVVGNASEYRYGLVQCSRDTSSGGCSHCLGQLMDDIQMCCKGKKGWRILTPSCYLRYEQYPFFAQQLAPPVLAPPVLSPPVLAPVTNAPPVTTNKGKGLKRTTKIILITVPIIATVVALFGFYLYYTIGRRKQKVQETGQNSLLNILEYRSSSKRKMEELMVVKDQDNNGEIHYFDLNAIQIATNNFSDANKLGQGGFGPVYKGKLHDGKEIAVKRLSRNSGQGLDEFKTEVKLIVKLQHRNLVKLIGCCIEGDETLLVYEYMANTSLDAFLFNATKCKELDWAKRTSLVHGIAKGLLYLHEDSRLKIIHRDLKASNILLDDEMNPKISDFGTARAFYGKQIEASTNRIVGTYGYMAPEYAMEGIFSIKSDVYSFGVLMLEVISGRKNNANLPARAQSLLPYAWRLWNDGKAQELIDRNLINNCPLREVVRWINIALLCVQENPEYRPSMSKVVLMLGGQSTDLPKPSEPPFPAGRYTMSDQSSSNVIATMTETDTETRSLTSDHPSTNASST